VKLANYIRKSKSWLSIAAIVSVILALPAVGFAANDAYGDGAYGACTYNTCGITLTSNGTVNINVIVGATTTCTTQSDSVGVTTDSSTGYTLSLNDSTTTSSLLGSGANTVISSSSSQSSPASLSTNTWGYRVDGVGGFGAGPTSASSNVAPSATTFAGIPISSAGGDTLAASSGAADPAVSTTVWYGICVNTTKPADTYSSTVVYTAVVN
jgi:hypothetical protein